MPVFCVSLSRLKRIELNKTVIYSVQTCTIMRSPGRAFRSKDTLGLNNVICRSCPSTNDWFFTMPLTSDTIHPNRSHILYKGSFSLDVYDVAILHRDAANLCGQYETKLIRGNAFKLYANK